MPNNRRAMVGSLLFGVLVPIVLAVLGIGVGIVMVENEYDRSLRKANQKVISMGGIAVQQIQIALSGSLNTAWMSAAYIMGELEDDNTQPIDHYAPNKTDRMIHVNYPKFKQFAERMSEEFPSVGSFQLQPSGVVTQAYPPLTPGVNPWGHDLFNDENRRADIRAGIKAQSTMIAGPYPLIQGGIAMLSRFPVFLRPKNITHEEFRQLSVEEILPHWWGMTASLVLIEKLLTAIDLPTRLPAGQVQYCLEYFNANTGSVVVVTSNLREFNVTAAIGENDVRRNLIESSFIRLDVELPGNRLWHLWVRPAIISDSRAVWMVVAVLITLAGCGFVAAIYWGPYLARRTLYRALMIVFEEIMVLNLEPDSIPARMPRDSPPDFVTTLQDMVAMLVEYRKFLPESLKQDREIELLIPETPIDEDFNDKISLRGSLRAAKGDRTNPLGASAAGLQALQIPPDSRPQSPNSRGSGSGRVVPMPALETGLISKSVAVVALEAESHIFLAANPKELDKLHIAFLQHVCGALARNKGSVNIVSGGNILIEFGAQRPVSNRCLMAVQTAHEVSTAADGVSLGVGYGKMSCGNVGTKNVMSFVLCGLQVELARALAKYGPRSGMGNVLTTASVHVAVQSYALFLPIDVALFQQWRHLETIYGVVEMYNMASTPTDEFVGGDPTNKEWMYELASNDKSSTLDEYIMEWRKCMSGSQPTIPSPTNARPTVVTRAMRRLTHVFHGYDKAQGCTVTLLCPATRAKCAIPEYNDDVESGRPNSRMSNGSILSSSLPLRDTGAGPPGPAPASVPDAASPVSPNRRTTASTSSEQKKNFFGVCN